VIALRRHVVASIDQTRSGLVLRSGRRPVTEADGTPQACRAAHSERR
jgi:hypothetical protein